MNLKLEWDRRDFCRGLAWASLATMMNAEAAAMGAVQEGEGHALVAATDRDRILKAATRYLENRPVTVTAFRSAKSPGGRHDFFSQADYFWPDPKNPAGPYVNRDGQSNPENFNDHRKAMVDMSIQMPALTAAWILTGDARFANHACEHLRAWFVDPETRMNPNLEYAQGVIGVSTGRSFGIIDTLHLVEVARAASLVATGTMKQGETKALIAWFADYLSWMKTSDKGKAERTALNNHATCWALQGSEFARLVGDEGTRDEIRGWYTGTFLPDQLGKNGAFPKELVRTKPYSYSIFNFDVMAGLCQSLKGKGVEMTKFALPDGRGLCKAATFLYPYLRDKSTWPYAKDVEHFDALPVRSPGLLFAGLACKQDEWIALWKRLDPDPTDKEIIRNFPIRQPLLWV